MAQGYTDPPRDGLTAAQVTWLLAHGPQVQIDQGCDLLDASNNFVADISTDMVAGGEVTGDNTVTGEQVAGKCQIQLMRELAWGRDRVRPWVSLSDGAITARFNQGVYVLTTPQQPSGETPTTYDVQGYDLTSLLTDQVGDTYVVAAGTTYLTALRNVLTASGVGAPLLLAGDAGSTALPYAMTWALYDGGPSWLSICADLLASIGYERLWADENGNLRSQPKTDPASRPLAWTFDVTDGSVDSLVSPGWTRDADLWSAPNRWTFIRSNTGGVSPTVDNGMVYKPPDNTSDGPSSIDSVGRVRPKVVFLDVPDAASLQAQGDLAVAGDKAAGVTINMSTFLPAIGHGDVVQFTAPGRSEKLPVATWTTNLDGTPGAWTLSTPAAESDTPLSASGAGTVTQASPLRIVMDGATVDSPANSLDGTAYAVGNRVTVTVRNPVPPLVQGVESVPS